MPQFAMFVAAGAGFGIEMVQALDVAHAQDIAELRIRRVCRQCRLSCSTARTSSSW